MPVTDKPAPIRVAHQPCKPHSNSTQTDRMAMVYRPGSLDALSLPSRRGNTLYYRDGRQEKVK